MDTDVEVQMRVDESARGGEVNTVQPAEARGDPQGIEAQGDGPHKTVTRGSREHLTDADGALLENLSLAEVCDVAERHIEVLKRSRGVGLPSVVRDASPMDLQLQITIDTIEMLVADCRKGIATATTASSAHHGSSSEWNFAKAASSLRAVLRQPTEPLAQMSAEGPKPNDLATVLSDLQLPPTAAIVLADLGITTVQDLLETDDSHEIDVVHALEEIPSSQSAGNDRKARTQFKKWLREQKATSDFTQGSAAPFSNVTNSIHTDGAEAATVLRIDVEPVANARDPPLVHLRIPVGSIERQRRRATSNFAPIISLLGPTGSGKSFFANSFVPAETPLPERPLVGVAGQSYATTAHVCSYPGFIRSADVEEVPVVLWDFEGEGGRLPILLKDRGLYSAARMLNLGVSKEALGEQLEDVIVEARRLVVREVLPVMAYAQSDVLVYVSTEPLHVTDLQERVRAMAEVGWKSMRSMGYRPALVIVQNRFDTEGMVDPIEFDVTNKYEGMVSALGGSYSMVRVSRVARSGDQGHFERSMLELHKSIKFAATHVRRLRELKNSLFTELEVWSLFPVMMKQFDSAAVRTNGAIKSLKEVSDSVVGSCERTKNALRLMLMFGTLPTTAVRFTVVVNIVLSWYAYALASDSRKSGEDRTKQRRHEEPGKVFDRVVECCSAYMPCTAKYPDDKVSIPCTLRKHEHGTGHSNPMMIKQQPASFVKRIVSFGLAKDRVPCEWSIPGGFMLGPDKLMTKEEFTAKVTGFQELDSKSFSTAFHLSEQWCSGASLSSSSNSSCICGLCLEQVEAVVLLSNPDCQHALCEDCIVGRRVLSQRSVVTCPFCHKDSRMMDDEIAPECARLRILSLDGGGVRGLIMVRVLKKLEESFAPLRLNSLFDLVIGTSAGGIIAMTTLANIPLEKVKDFMERFASDILDSQRINQLWCYATAMCRCNHMALEDALQDLFSGRSTAHYNGPPYGVCTSVDVTDNEVKLWGNVPAVRAGIGAAPPPVELWKCARMTSAAPTFFEPFIMPDSGPPQIGFVKNGRAYVDGGLLANCPALHGLQLAMKAQSTAKETASASEDRDHPPVSVTDSVEMMVSLGTGLPKATVNSGSGNVVTWGLKLVEIATDSAAQWKREVENNPLCGDLPRIRINPADLGSLDPFSSKSIQDIAEGMDNYFASAMGQAEMCQMTHLVFAKLWTVRCSDGHLAVGNPVEFQIVLRDLPHNNFETLSRESLNTIITARGGNALPHYADYASVVRSAEAAFTKQPFQSMPAGRFSFEFDGGSRVELDEGARSFEVTPTHARTADLKVVWDAKGGGRIPISGDVRIYLVREE